MGNVSARHEPKGADLNPSVLITGVSGDVGSAIAEQFLSEGWEVWGSYGTSPPANPAVRTLSMDIRQAESVVSALNEWSHSSRDPACLIHAAGSPSSALLPTLTEERWKDELDIHLQGAVRVAQAASRIFIPRKAGHLLFIGSLAALRPHPGQSIYAAAKGGVESLTRALAREWAPKKIRVNTIAPGFLQSATVSKLPDSMKTRILKQIPLQRWGEPSEVADLASFLSSKHAAYITGQVFRIDGGASL